MLTEISVAFIQHENGTPHFSTEGELQLKYSFFDQSIYPSPLSPQQLNCIEQKHKSLNQENEINKDLLFNILLIYLR